MVSSDIAMDRPVVLTIPQEHTKYAVPSTEAKRNSNQKSRVRPISAKPIQDNYRSLVSQNRTKTY